MMIVNVKNFPVTTLGTTLVVLFTLAFPPSHAIPEYVQRMSTSASPESGEWTASTGFGEFTFTVNPEATGISKISFNFSNFACGPARISSGKFWVNGLWLITDSHFTITLFKIVINGSFDETASRATGTWQIDSIETTCGGTWESTTGLGSFHP